MTPAAFIKLAMMAWIPLARHVYFGESLADVDARYEKTANDIAAVAFDSDEPSVFRGSQGRIKTALEMASIASFEGGFQKVVEDGTCNDPNYKADGRGSCDNKHAFTNWQIHADDMGWHGLILQGTGITSARWAPDYAKTHPDEVWTGARLIANPRAAARVALHLIRQSWHQFGSLCAFTGETNDREHQCVGPHPKADVRHERAMAYLSRHPYTEE